MAGYLCKNINQKNGVCAFSSDTVVSGPWPGQIKVSAGAHD